jgi:hypothetical protein
MASFNYPVIADNVGGLASLNSKRAPALFRDPSFVRVPSTTLRPVVRNLPTGPRSQIAPQQNEGNAFENEEASKQVDSHSSQERLLSTIDPTASAAVVLSQPNNEHFGFVKNHPYLAGVVFLLLCMFAVVGYFYYKHNSETEQKCNTSDLSDIASGVVAATSSKPATAAASPTSTLSSSVEGSPAPDVATKSTVANGSTKPQNMAIGGTELFAGARSEVLHTACTASSQFQNSSKAQAPSPPQYTQEQLQQFITSVKSNPQLLSAYRRQMQLIVDVQRQKLLEQYKQTQGAPALHV